MTHCVDLGLGGLHTASNTLGLDPSVSYLCPCALCFLGLCALLCFVVPSSSDGNACFSTWSDMDRSCSLPFSMAFLLLSPLAVPDPLFDPLSAPSFFAISFYGPSSANKQPMGPARCQALPAPFWGLVSLLPLSPCLRHSHLASRSPFPQLHRALTLVIIQFYEKPPGLPLNGLTTTGTRCAIRAWGYEGGRERGRKGHGWLEGAGKLWEPGHGGGEAGKT